MSAALHIRGYHPLWPAFPCRSASTTDTTGLFHFRSPLLAESPLMSVPPGTEMFQFPGFASNTYVFSAGYPKGVGCPIRTPRDQSLLAAPPGFSQRATSFIASWRQGIHQMPFSCSTTHTQLELTPKPPCKRVGYAHPLTEPTMHRNHPRPQVALPKEPKPPRQHTGRNALPIPWQAILITQHTHSNASEHCSHTSNQACRHPRKETTACSGSDTHASTATDLPRQPRTNPHHKDAGGPKPPEMSCASRDAPEPDSQSIKNNTTPPRPMTGQRSYRPCHLPPRFAEAVMAGPIPCRPLNPSCQNRGEPT